MQVYPVTAELDALCSKRSQALLNYSDHYSQQLSGKVTGQYSNPHVLPKICINPRIRKLEYSQKLHISKGQITLLSTQFPKAGWINFSVEQGVTRFWTSFDNHFDITLAFCGICKSEWLRLPRDRGLFLEAMTDCVISFTYLDSFSNHDFLMNWLLELHLVGHLVSVQQRIECIFMLLMGKLGIKLTNSELVLLPFPLSHGRIVELIGSTRSTVTRQITRLRQKHLLSIDEVGGEFLFSTALNFKPMMK